jgi:hypothetical protein
VESYQPRVLRPDPSHRRAEVGILSRADVTNEEPSPRLPYSWNCAWCKRQYVGLDRREPAHVRGHGSYLFCTTHCLRAWQTEQIPPALRREVRYAVVSPPARWRGRFLGIVPAPLRQVERRRCLGHTDCPSSPNGEASCEALVHATHRLDNGVDAFPLVGGDRLAGQPRRRGRDAHSSERKQHFRARRLYGWQQDGPVSAS